MNIGRGMLYLTLALLAGGCASFDGHGLVQAGANASEVTALMGPPSARVATPDGGEVLYFSRLPAGRQIFAVTLGPDGRTRAIRPLLTRENIDRLRAGEMNQREVRELIGPPDPYERIRFARQQREVWTYPWRDVELRRMLSVQFSDDGVLREVLDLRDDYHESPGGLP